MTTLTSLSIRRGRFTIGARPCVRAVYVGGNYNDNTYAGVSYVNAYYSLTSSDDSIGSRLSFVFDADPASNSQSGGEITINPIDTQYSIVNGSVSFNASSTPTSVTYTASEITDGLTVSISGTAITVSSSTEGTYTFKLTASANGYTSDSKIVTVIVDPILKFTNSATEGKLTVKGST